MPAPDLTAHTTAEWWDIDNVSLNQYGWNVSTFGGGRYDLPPLRGDNIQVAYRPGSVHRAKFADSRTIALVMWVTGMAPDTGLDTGDHVLRFNDSWEFLRRLVWRPYGTQVLLTRRWRLTLPGGPTLVQASGWAQVADAMAPTMTGRTRATFTMNLLMADPYFYGHTIETTLPAGTTTVTNPGADVAAYNNIHVDLVGPLNWPVLKNLTTNPQSWVRYGANIPSGTTIRLNCANYTATNLNTGANVIGLITNYGARRWVSLEVGDNQLNLTGGAGHAALSFQPPYV